MSALNTVRFITLYLVTDIILTTSQTRALELFMNTTFFRFNSIKTYFIKTAAITTLALASLTPAHANLMITPTRVVFDDSQKNNVVTLLNSAKTTKTYRIELVNKIQRVTGGYTDISADASYPGQSAKEYLRYSPRLVTIEPGKYQKIKLRLRLPDGTPQGEYRTHLAMRVIDTGDTSPSADKTQGGEGMKTSVRPRVSFSIPVIVRHGDLDVATQINKVEFLPKANNKSKPNLKVEIGRSGNSSSFGLMNAYMKAPNSNQVQQIGQLNNVALFTELESKQIKIPLWVDTIPNNAVIQVMYQGEDEFKGRTLGQAAFRYSQ